MNQQKKYGTRTDHPLWSHNVGPDLNFLELDFD